MKGETIEARKTVILSLKVLRQEVTNQNSSQLHKFIAYLEISNYIRGFCYGNLDITYNSYKLITRYIDRLGDTHHINRYIW